MSNKYPANVALKINVKVGGRNTFLLDAISRRIPNVTDVLTIIYGADVTHLPFGGDSSPSIAAVTISYSSSYHRLSSVSLKPRSLRRKSHKDYSDFDKDVKRKERNGSNDDTLQLLQLHSSQHYMLEKVGNYDDRSYDDLFLDIDKILHDILLYQIGVVFIWESVDFMTYSVFDDEYLLLDNLLFIVHVLGLWRVGFEIRLLGSSRKRCGGVGWLHILDGEKEESCLLGKGLIIDGGWETMDWEVHDQEGGDVRWMVISGWIVSR
ncbi:hypothetical protein L6452_01344 [Arctium lappa]|uniref:Uncharacterized protein n=1 Tax=Arctium lappa TaxID=4217 RepID=A0ACB9FH21_ARCLA|nr:hypothetical protein L6452_01344 [Arctium lappa]